MRRKGREINKLCVSESGITLRNVCKIWKRQEEHVKIKFAIVTWNSKFSHFAKENFQEKRSLSMSLYETMMDCYIFS